MAINTNVGPERVEVNAQPIGDVLVQGASTARTCLVVATKKADAPLNTPTPVRSPSEFEAIFGGVKELGEAFYSMRGFYQNAGQGAELIVIAVSPSGVSGKVFEFAEDESPRSITGSFGLLLDDGELLTGASLIGYDKAKGEAELDISGATGEFSDVKAGDFLRDAEGRLFLISDIKSGNKLIIESGLDQDLKKAAKAISEDGSSMEIVRLYSDGLYDGKMVIQEGSVYGSQISVSVSGDILTLSGFDTTLNDVRSGDIIEDSNQDEYVIVDVIDGDNIQVDRSGLTAGAVDIKRGIKKKALLTDSDAGSEYLDLAVAPYEAADGKVRFKLVDSANNPPEDILKGYFLEFDDGTKLEIKGNKIVAESTVISSAFTGTVSYNAATGALTATGETLQTDGVKGGDVFIDATGKEYIIQEVTSEIELQLKKNLASPSSLAGARVNKGAMELDVEEDLSAKLSGEVSVDATGSISYPVNKLVFDQSESLKSDDYFVIEPAFQSSDYSGSATDLSGLRALDAVDTINLIGIPGIYDPVVQQSLIDYCSITRDDCMALVSIPEFITSASIDEIKVANLAISSVQESVNGSIINLLASPDLSEVATYDLLRIGSSQFTVKSVSDEDDQIVVFETAGIPTVGAVSVASPSAISWKDEIVNKPTTKVAWYYNHLIVAEEDGGQAVIDPIGHAAGVMARIDANIAQGGISHAPAGIQLAQIAGISGLQLDISERLDGGPLRKAFINRITSSTGNGRYIFGGYTGAGSSATPDEQLIQVIRSVLFVKSSLEVGLVGFLWENNSPVNRQNIENSIRSFLRANSYLFPAGLPEAQQFQVESITPDDLALAQGLVEVRIQVRFNTAIRFISIDLAFPLPLSDN